MAAEMLTPQNSSLDEMLECLSDEQEELLLVVMREIFFQSEHTRRNPSEQRALVESLAGDEKLLKAFTKMLNRQQNRGTRRWLIKINGPNYTRAVPVVKAAMRGWDSALRLGPLRDHSQHFRLLLQTKSLQTGDRVVILPFRGDDYCVPAGPILLFDIWG